MKTLSVELAEALANALRWKGVSFHWTDIMEWEPWKTRAAAMWAELGHVRSIPFDAFIAQRAALPHCLVCGCSDDDACPGGCYWVGPALCSSCAGASAGVATDGA
jgi:hypothetical protein